jgi:hypothetical protein
LESWWTSFGLLLVSAVFLGRRGSEECGAELVVRDSLENKAKNKTYKQKNDCSRAGGEVKEETFVSSEHA